MRGERGDTIIEVMLAFAVFSFVVIGSVMLMNKGLAMAQRSLELTLVRQQIDAQLTMLGQLKQKDPAAWRALTVTAADSENGVLSGDLSAITDCPKPTDLSNAYFIAPTNTRMAVKAYAISPTNYKPAVTYANVDSFARTALPPSTDPLSYGMWVSLVKSEGFITNHAYDVHVRGCWYSAGDSIGRPTVIATVTRMYDAN